MKRASLQQHHQLAVRIGRRANVIAVRSIREASEVWCKYRDRKTIGASVSPLVTVVDVNSGKTVARISYNGRAWAKDGKEIPLS